MSYDNLYNITGKKLTMSQTNLQFGGTLSAGHEFAYAYAEDNKMRLSTVQTRQYNVDGAIDNEAVATAGITRQQRYDFDESGNMTAVSSDSAGALKSYLWDEENRLLAVNNNGGVSCYFYDAAGERTVKLTSEFESVHVNGAKSGGDGAARFTAYVSPYFVVNNGGRYTKHVYAASQSIASKLGNISSFGSDPRRVETAGNQQFGALQEALTATIQARYDSLKMSYEKPNNSTIIGGDVAKDSTVDSQEKESLIFFFHPDHLGSTSYVTGADGTVSQHVEYIPYGEVFVEERNSSFLTSYLFNAKELDEETGMYYYGARYLDPTAAMWISVDPMWEKFAGMSAYNYCAGNPVKMVDPDGRALRMANAESFNTLLSSLPIGARGMIKMNKNGFVDAESVGSAYSKYSNSGNLQALNTIVSDKRTVDFCSTSTKYDYINSESGKVETYEFKSPTRVNDFQELMKGFDGTPEEKQIYAQQLNSVGINDEIYVSGNFGATLRPSDAQEPYIGGQVSNSGTFQVFVNPVGTTPTEKAQNVGHELFGHLYFYFIGKDPRHAGTNNLELERQIINREKESEINCR